jgi:hypothetical protein
MLAPMAEVVRTPIGPDARLPTRRTLDERFYVRFPGTYAVLARAVNRLPPRSRLRRALLRRAVLSGWASWARRDFELNLLGYAPDCHMETVSEWTAAGQRSSYEGHAGRREIAADWFDAMERMDLIPQEIIDAGNPSWFSATSASVPEGAGSSSITPSARSCGRSEAWSCASRASTTGTTRSRPPASPRQP